MLDRRAFLGSAVAANAALTGLIVLGQDKKRRREDDERRRDDDDRRREDERLHYRAKQILGSKVYIDDDRSVGTVDDIVMDQDGNVDYLIVVDQQKKLVSIPWDATQFDATERRAVVHISQEKYQEVPTYTTQQYPTFATPTYRTQTYQYFGLTPGQQRRLIRRGKLPD